MRPDLRNIPQARFLRGLATSPKATALRVGADTFSYQQLHDLALRWSGALLADAAEPPKRIGVLAGKGIESYAGILAALYCGAAAVPLQPGFPAVRTRRMLEASGVTALVADAEGLSALADTGLTGIPVLAPLHGGDDQFYLIREHRPLDEPRPVQPDDLGYLLFTSGSTGRPKGVPISHGSLDHYFGLMDRRYDFTPDDVFSQATELNFDCAMFELYCAWGAGASVHPVPAQAYLNLPAFLAERQMTVWFSTPSTIALVRRTGGLTTGAMPTLRWSFFAGEALLCSDAADWQAAAPGSAVENLYGPTELTITITGHRWEPATSRRLSVNGVVPIGTVHPGHDHLLLADDRSLTDSEGELCITGPQMTTSYLAPEDNAGRFLFYDHRTWYRTGDRVGRREGGQLVYLGRLDSQVQVQGWRVELAEVDDAIRSCDGVTGAVTVTRPIDGGIELVVYYTGTPVPPAVLNKQLREILPSGFLPRHYRHLEDFPLNSNRKIDRLKLATDAALNP